MLALRRATAALGNVGRACPAPRPLPKPRRIAMKRSIPATSASASLLRKYCSAASQSTEDESDPSTLWQEELKGLGEDYALGNPNLRGDEKDPPGLANIHRHIPADQFNWGSIKDQVFGEFGKRSPPMAIRRLSFVPEPTPDEAIDTKIPTPEPMGGFSEYEPSGGGWHIPLVPKPRPISRDGNTVTGLGRRKRAVANVTMTPGSGKIMINGRHWMYYFKDAPIRNNILEPLTLTEYLNKWDIDANIAGGGFRGQAGAMRLAISRALLRWDPELQPPLKRAGYLTRDKREVERKKPGKLKARRSFQWVKR